MNQHSSTRIKEMYSNMALMVRIPASEEFSREEMASKQEQLKMLTQFVDMLTPEGAKPKKSLGS